MSWRRSAWLGRRGILVGIVDFRAADEPGRLSAGAAKPPQCGAGGGAGIEREELGVVLRPPSANGSGSSQRNRAHLRAMAAKVHLPAQCGSGRTARQSTPDRSLAHCGSQRRPSAPRCWLEITRRRTGLRQDVAMAQEQNGPRRRDRSRVTAGTCELLPALRLPAATQ